MIQCLARTAEYFGTDHDPGPSYAGDHAAVQLVLEMTPPRPLHVIVSKQ